jgi:hypothetical protein
VGPYLAQVDKITRTIIAIGINHMVLDARVLIPEKLNRYLSVVGDGVIKKYLFS